MIVLYNILMVKIRILLFFFKLFNSKIRTFINERKNISPDKLVFLKAISNVIKSGMNIVGVDTPEKM